ncbi:MAG TPA: DMT family transporter [Solirubrobacterales bacterium]|jgi:drug/metabolite transporter (DMT)-like permease
MSGRAWIAFGAVAFLWGIPYLLIKVALEDLSPLFVVWARVAIAAAIVLPIAWASGALRGLGAHWPSIAAYAAAEVAIPFPLIALGEVSVSSSLTAMIIAAMPLVVVLLGLRLAPGEQLGQRRLTGLLVGLLGTVALLAPAAAGDGASAVGVLLIALATCSYACSVFVVRRRLALLPPLGPVAAGLALACLALTPYALLHPPASAPSGAVVAALVALGLGCTALALVAFFYLAAKAGPGPASLVTYVNPSVAAVAGAVVLNESVTAIAVVGLVLTVFGSWLSAAA